MLKNLCQAAGVAKSKVFPHDFRHLFARTYYAVKKDIVRLADILGHLRINTTYRKIAKHLLSQSGFLMHGVVADVNGTRVAFLASRLVRIAMGELSELMV